VIVITRILVGVSGLLLLVTAYYHSTGLPDLEKAIAAASLPEFFSAAIPVQWLFFSWHLTVLSVPLIWSALFNSGWLLTASVVCGLVLLGDFFWVFSATGWFPGTVVLLLVVLLLAAASVIRYLASRATITQ
jgi:hypothetical protein